MFFQTWWQGILFGLVTTIGMLAVCYAFAMSWKKYEGTDKKANQKSCNAHH
ncbi:hypothetical protein [Desulfoscipio geothermicus]|uniref:Uncharacterized protein n=1 Tax=Desulfoscipio geothermicus DSM 3669 TaxID=1121426 RepID=A0A1I6DLN1_9FIRM|nr:hypothetical protein [Desulfoscipio geothermicus]SFR06287.1 hypothetical protein SAMN05660706_11337 [Desulfoscipio geothermicus DSM 3669]